MKYMVFYRTRNSQDTWSQYDYTSYINAGTMHDACLEAVTDDDYFGSSYADKAKWEFKAELVDSADTPIYRVGLS